MRTLEIENLRIEFPGRRGMLLAIDDVSLYIDKGEILGVVGESGAGKSLTGASLVGLLEPPGRVTGGRILLNGRDITNLPDDKMREIRGGDIGTIFQDPLTSLDPLHTVGSQLIETIRTHTGVSRSAARRRAAELLRMVGIPAVESRLDSYPHQFSGGMRQRVVIALALACEPSLIVADEPTTALDVSVQSQIISLLKDLCREADVAIMLITHDMGVIAEAADRVCVMYSGRVVETGRVRDVLDNPLHPYAQGLIGSIPVIGGNRERLTSIEGAMPRLDSRPSGCAFHPRCKKAFEDCLVKQPQLTAVASGRSAACLLLEGEHAL